MRDIRESDWKLFRELHVDARDRFCERVLAEVGRLIVDKDKSAHQKYLAMYRHVHDRDRELARAFNDPRRSVAVVQLAVIRAAGLLTDEEFERFTPETREAVEAYLRI